MSEKLKAKDIIITVVVVILFAVGLVLVLNIYKSEGEKRSASVSDLGEKDPNHIEVDVTLVSIDPNKGDIVARLEFLPKGSYTKDDGILARDVKLFVNGATGKQETDFPKGKKMNPMEVVVQMYDGLVTDYPFDQHKAYLEMYFVPGKPEKKSAEPGAAKPAEAAPSPTPKPEAAAEEEPKKEAPKEEKPRPQPQVVVAATPTPEPLKTPKVEPPPQKPEPNVAKAVEIVTPAPAVKTPEPAPVAREEPKQVVREEPPKPIVREDPKPAATTTPPQPVKVEEPPKAAPIVAQTQTNSAPAKPQPPIQTAVVTPRSNGFPLPILVGGFFAIAVGGGFAFLHVRRRAKSAGSIISQALPRSGPVLWRK